MNNTASAASALQLAQPTEKPTFSPLLRVIFAAVAVRAWLLFGTAWMPGINGAYYLVQARSLLEKGTLGVPDLPLEFVWLAALAKALSFGTGSLESTLLLAVKLSDSLLPPLVAWPVYSVAAKWCVRQNRPTAWALWPAAVVALGAPAMTMEGDFQKNSLALVWLGALIAALSAWLEKPDARRAAMALFFLALAGLTHIGVCGAALLLAFGVVLSYAVLQREAARTLWPWLGAAVFTVLAVSTLVLWKFDPARIYRLFTAFTQPTAFLGDGVQMPGPPLGPPGGPNGGPPFFALLLYAPNVLFAAVALSGLTIAWRRRMAQPASQSAIAAGCALTILALTGPWMHGDKLQRFALIAMVPATLTGTFVALNTRRVWLQRTIAGAGLLLCLTTFPLAARGSRTVLSDAALRELASLRPLITRPRSTLISAQHGVEWWTAWLLRTHIAQGSALRSHLWRQYDTVLFLEVKSGFGMPGPGGPPGIGPPGQGMGNGAPRQPMQAAPIPGGAKILHDGPHLKLAQVNAPPSFVLEKESRAETPLTR